MKVIALYGQYGWAIVVMVVCIGALVYFGVLSPENLMPIDQQVENACATECEAKDMWFDGKVGYLEQNTYKCSCRAYLNITWGEVK